MVANKNVTNHVSEKYCNLIKNKSKIGLQVGARLTNTDLSVPISMHIHDVVSLDKMYFTISERVITFVLKYCTLSKWQ